MRNELVNKIWSEHDHSNDDKLLYSDGWADCCARFEQELQGKYIVEWHMAEDGLPPENEIVYAYILHRYYKIETIKTKKRNSKSYYHS